jgi:hypothetical protein
MIAIPRINDLLISAQETLLKYDILLKENPDSLFYKGVTINTRDQIKDLQRELKIEKERRSKEIIDLKLQGGVANHGTLPLEMLGKVSKLFSDLILETAKMAGFGSKSNNLKNRIVKETIDLRIERLVPGSTHLIITANTSPDLFGNSIVEDSLHNTFAVLNASKEEELISALPKLGSSGILKLQNLLEWGVKNKIDLGLDWESSISQHFSWNGVNKKALVLYETLSSIQILEPIEEQFEGVVSVLKLKGQFEVNSEFGTKIIRFSNSQLQSVKQLRLEEHCSGVCLKKVTFNRSTGKEGIEYELVNLDV